MWMVHKDDVLVDVAQMQVCKKRKRLKVAAENLQILVRKQKFWSRFMSMEQICCSSLKNWLCKKLTLIMMKQVIEICLCKEVSWQVMADLKKFMKQNRLLLRSRTTVAWKGSIFME